MVIIAVIVVPTCVSLCSYHFRWGKLDVVKYMVTKSKCDVNPEDEDGKTPLDLARE